MENTFHDLQQCVDNWDDVESKSEKEYRKMIFELAKEIVERGIGE
jgi:hypothetical protein